MPQRVPISGAEVLCVGELLWDSLPAGLFLGGAPFNVAGHLHALGVPVAMLSRVGSDRLAIEAVARITRRGIATDLIQSDDTLPTGFVSVELDPDGTPAYEIAEPAAWDAIELEERVLQRAARARAIVFGTLAQRAPATRATIRRLCELDVPKVFDVNLRPPFDDAEVVRESLDSADVVKLNEGELARLDAMLDLGGGLGGRPGDTALHTVREAAQTLGRRFGCGAVCVTRGAGGALLLREGRWSEHPGYRVQVRDTVGAGDAFLAALIPGLLAGAGDAETLRRANLLGAFVATRAGAIPDHDAGEMARIAAQDP
jgi:fructokinase